VQVTGDALAVVNGSIKPRRFHTLLPRQMAVGEFEVSRSALNSYPTPRRMPPDVGYTTIASAPDHLRKLPDEEQPVRSRGLQGKYDIMDSMQIQKCLMNGGTQDAS
jgi:hypothetical protein